MMPKIFDRHNRFRLIEAHKDIACIMLSKLYKKLGHAMNFNFWNPSGHYNLNLGVPEQRDVAKIIMILNRQVYNKIVAGELKDRSQKGNKSYIRNEKLSGGHFTWTPDFQLPEMGTLEFDFVYLVPNRPKQED